MISKQMQDSENSCLEGLVPRGLIDCGEKILEASVTSEGLCPIKINLKAGRINDLQPIEIPNVSSLKILLPRFVEPHAHLDKAFTWERFPNLAGTYEGALEANLKEHQCRTKELVLIRAERALQRSLFNGLRAIRSHVDSLGIYADETWEALLELKQTWKQLIELELVALVPLNYWNTNQGKFLAKKVAKQGGLLGGVIIPPFKSEKVRDDLSNLFRLANELGCGVDLHIDESFQEPASGLKQLIYVLDQMHVDVPITCSHLSSMSLLNPKDLRYFSAKLVEYEINVIALPLTNSWLLGRQKRDISSKKIVAPISQLQKAGVNVAIGGDNVRDPWFPGGNFDPLMLMSLSMPIVQLAPWNRFGISPFTTAPAQIMNLQWDGTIGIDAPADFIYLEANSWSEVLSENPNREIIVNGEVLQGKFLET